jgi:hypothetical protein
MRDSTKMRATWLHNTDRGHVKKIALLGLIVSFLAGCAIEDRYGDREEPRRVCVDRARETGHAVRGVTSVRREDRDRYRVTLDVDPVTRPAGVNSDLICEYNDQSRTADLHW